MQGHRNRFLSDQPPKLKARFLILRNHAVKLRMKGLICELFDSKLLAWKIEFIQQKIRFRKLRPVQGMAGLPSSGDPAMTAI